MPYQVKTPDGETFILDKTDAFYGVEGESSYVIIREATHSENRQRSSLFAEITRVMDPTGKYPNQIKIQQSLNSDELIEMDIYLTLSGSNLLDENGKDLFRFKKVGSIMKVDMTEREFKDAIGKLEDRVVDEIHEKVALKNPDWFGASGEAK